jgi:hypothetical protein
MALPRLMNEDARSGFGLAVGASVRLREKWRKYFKNSPGEISRKTDASIDH